MIQELIMQSNAERYLDGTRTFVPDATDNPDCVPFYRAWRGVQNVLDKPTLDKWHHLLHEAICTASYKPEHEQYATFIGHLRYMAERWIKPNEPRPSYGYECEPSEPIEHDARQFFNSEYKRAFPGKRANSKEANRLYEEKREQAVTILREQYNIKRAAYEAREAERDARNQRARDEWIAQFWSMAEFEQLIRNIEHL
jgi:hypothetical protein